MFTVREIVEGTFILPDQLVKDIKFFKTKFQHKKFRYDSERLRVRVDILKYCDVIFNCRELLEFEKACNELVKLCKNKHSLFGVHYSNIYYFLDTMDKLRDFYEINKYACIKDKRISHIMRLKTMLLCMTAYFEKWCKSRPKTRMNMKLEEALSDFEDGIYDLD